MGGDDFLSGSGAHMAGRTVFPHEDSVGDGGWGAVVQAASGPQILAQALKLVLDKKAVVQHRDVALTAPDRDVGLARVIMGGGRGVPDSLN
jgi:hypothetical protein